MSGWHYDNKPFEPTEAIRGIVYRMSLDGFWYIGKKTIKSPKGKPTKYQDYFGSGKRWLQHISGREQEVERQVVYLCANKTEMAWWEDYELARTLAVWNPKSFNENFAMKVNKTNSKNFLNMNIIELKINEIK